MPLGLPVSRVASVSISLTPQAAAFENFDTLLIVGDSPVIDTTQRIRSYASATEVGADFPVTAPEFLAAELFFSQSPEPTQVFIGRWAKTPTRGRLLCGIQSGPDQVISNWTIVTNGSFGVMLDGISFQLADLDFSSETNLNGVASVMQTALQNAGATPPVQPVVTVTSSGSLSSGTIYTKITYVTSLGETAASSEANVTVAAGDGVTVTSPTAPNASIVGYNVYAASTSGAETRQNASTVQIGTDYVIDALVVGDVPPSVSTGRTAASAGATCQWTGSWFQFETGDTGVSATVSFLSPTGQGTDISALLLGTAATAQYAVQGAAAESALQAVVTLSGLATQWWACGFATGNNNADLADSDVLAVAAFIEASGPSTGNPHVFGVTTMETNALSAAVSTDIGAELMVAGYQRTFAQYSSYSAFAAFCLFGKALTVDLAGTNTMLTLMWKEVAGITYETLTTAQANALDGKRYNYYALFNNGSAIIVNGTMASADYFDEVFGMDAFANEIQTDIFNLFATSPTKIPQTDPGVHEIVLTVQQACEKYVTNGFLAPGVWTSAGFGPLQPGQMLSKGYLVYAPPIATQSVADRAQRKSPTIQVAAKEAGAIHDIIVSVSVNR